MLKTWKTHRTGMPGYPTRDICGKTLQEAVNAHIWQLAQDSKSPHEHIISIPETATLQYNPGILGGRGGIVALMDCTASTCYTRESPDYHEYPKQCVVWIYASPDDL